MVLRSEAWKAILYVDNLFDDDEIKSGLMNTDYGFFPDGQNLFPGSQPGIAAAKNCRFAGELQLLVIPSHVRANVPQGFYAAGFPAAFFNRFAVFSRNGMPDQLNRLLR